MPNSAFAQSAASFSLFSVALSAAESASATASANFDASTVTASGLDAPMLLVSPSVGLETFSSPPRSLISDKLSDRSLLACPLLAFAIINEQSGPNGGISRTDIPGGVPPPPSSSESLSG